MVEKLNKYRRFRSYSPSSGLMRDFGSADNDGCVGCAGISAGSLEAWVTVSMGVFLATERLDVTHVEVLNNRFIDYSSNILTSKN